MHRLPLQLAGHVEVWYLCCIYWRSAPLTPSQMGSHLCSLHCQVAEEEEAGPQVCVAAELGLEPRSPDYIHWAPGQPESSRVRDGSQARGVGGERVRDGT